MAGIAGLAIAPFHRPRATSAVVSQGDETVEEHAGIDSPPVATAEPPPISAPAVDRSAGSGPEGAPTAATPAISFRDLSEPERHILKTLWEGQQGLPLRGEHFTLHVGQQAGNFSDFSAGRDLLLARGWIRPTVRPQTVCLTAPGIRFCAAQAAAIGAYPAFYPRRGAAAEAKKTPGF